MYKILILLIVSLFLQGCMDMETAKGEQYCSDNNTSLYQIYPAREGIRVIQCKNGLIKRMPEQDFELIIGPEVEKQIKEENQL